MTSGPVEAEYKCKKCGGSVTLHLRIDAVVRTHPVSICSVKMQPLTADSYACSRCGSRDFEAYNLSDKFIGKILYLIGEDYGDTEPPGSE